MRAGGLKTTTTLHLGLIRKAAGSESEQYVAHLHVCGYTEWIMGFGWEKAAVLKWKNSTKGSDVKQNIL